MREDECRVSGLMSSSTLPTGTRTLVTVLLLQCLLWPRYAMRALYAFGGHWHLYFQVFCHMLPCHPLIHVFVCTCLCVHSGYFISTSSALSCAICWQSEPRSHSITCGSAAPRSADRAAPGGGTCLTRLLPASSDAVSIAWSCEIGSSPPPDPMLCVCACLRVSMCLCLCVCV